MRNSICSNVIYTFSVSFQFHVWNIHDVYLVVPLWNTLCLESDCECRIHSILIGEFRAKLNGFDLGRGQNNGIS